ncbi:hypothetical protein QOZ84_00135 [Romboutsia sedimentorum]|uniref:Uncharacterized protein n=1 Tax=Romboutsia sedimentorum TaxID=1368474 RepID=A0ABT7E8V0_9FIRM|nr:hypothetical protein [Romboutsia sedimentorum]MDK2561940.1 hypothetical protein [Romboutsia sedimentorum]MDK2586734.1 hypothetical protein [Romboutsia sedimentorum]
MDEQKAEDLEYDIEGLHFIMSSDDFNKYGDIVIEDTGYGFKVGPENAQDDGGCGGGCSGCGQ